MSLVVSDASPIRYLVAIKHVDILPRLFSKVVVPEHVIMHELRGRRTPLAVREWAVSPPAWVEVRTPETCQACGLHLGEEQAIALACELGAPVLLDEKQARGFAESKGLIVVGTLGLLERAAQQSLIDLRSALEALQETNFRVHPSLIRKLSQTGL